jgi:hypothetical protein
VFEEELMSVSIPIAIGAGFVGLSAFAVYSGIGLRRAKQERFIRQFVLPQGLFKKLQEKRPGLDSRYHSLVAQRQFFLCHLKSGRKFVSMPSQVVDDLWHEFILYTRNYQQFCSKAFGGYMHHTPAVTLGRGQTDDVGLKRAWRYACLEENVNPKAPKRLPLLVAIDAHCGSHLGSGCGGGGSGWGDSWFGSDSGESFFGSGDSGGSSCGGGGCGGGD